MAGLGKESFINEHVNEGGLRLKSVKAIVCWTYYIAHMSFFFLFFFFETGLRKAQPVMSGGFDLQIRSPRSTMVPMLENSEYPFAIQGVGVVYASFGSFDLTK